MGMIGYYTTFMLFGKGTNCKFYARGVGVNKKLQFMGQSPPCLKGGAPQGRGDIKPKYYDIPQSNCLKSAICQPPLGKGAKAAFGGKQSAKLQFETLCGAKHPLPMAAGAHITHILLPYH